MKKKVLIVGSSGLVGSRVSELLSNNYKVINGDRNSQNNQDDSQVYIDITDSVAVDRIVTEIAPDVIIHLAALTNLEQCQKDQALAYKINVSGTQNMLESSYQAQAHFIYISTGFVFDGKNSPYKELDTPHPTNYYAETKYKGELLVEKYQGRWSIVRFNYPYRGCYQAKSDCVRWMIPKLQKGEEITVVKNQYVKPVLIDKIVEGVQAIIENQANGYFHFADFNRVTWVEFACQLADVFGFDKNLIKGISYEKFIEQTKRLQVPLDVSLDTMETEKKLGIKMLSVKEGLEMIKESIN